MPCVRVAVGGAWAVAEPHNIDDGVMLEMSLWTDTKPVRGHGHIFAAVWMLLLIAVA